MGSSRYCWALAATVLPMLAPMPALGQTAGGNASADLGRTDSSTGKRAELPAKKTPRRTRSRTNQSPDVASPNDWNPSYFRGKEQFIAGRYDEALTELAQNVAECSDIDFDARKRQNIYFDHVWTSITQMGQSPHDFIRASNLQWVGAALAAQGRIDQAETRFTEMENYAAQCFPGRYNTFEGCSCQGQAYLLAARGQYDEAADRYLLALTHIEENKAQIGLPPAPCVAMILVALADVELARDRPDSAQRYLKRAQQIQEAQQRLGIGPAPLDKAALHTLFAQLRMSQDRNSEAFDLFAQALSMIKDVREDHPLTAFCLDGLGEIDLARGRLGPSADHFQESLAVRKSTLGESHRELAYSYDGLARVALAQEKPEAAESFFRDATSILVRELGPTHPDSIAISNHARTRHDPAHPTDGPMRIRARFLAIPTLLTLGWQVLYVGKDWRELEKSIRLRDAKADRAIQKASMPRPALQAGDTPPEPAPDRAARPYSSQRN
jgi:tetratricopeptide (TPR) repeat protein